MKEAFLDLLQCPRCGNAYRLSAERRAGAEVVEGRLTCACDKAAPIVRGVPRFVDTDGYTASFSLEWKVFSKVQLEAFNRDSPMADHTTYWMRANLDFPLEDLRGRLMLDAGCGPGRFCDVALAHGATVVGVDYSLAIDSAYENLAGYENVHLLQGDLFNLPLKPEVFDLVFSRGVLHHTPDPEKAFRSIAPFVKPGGKLSVRVYTESYRNGINDWYRKLTKRLPKPLLLALCAYSVPWHYVVRLPIVGGALKHLLLHLDYPDWRWRYLDTFDYFSPWYQFYLDPYHVVQWYKRAGFTDIELTAWAGSFIGRRPSAALPAQAAVAVQADLPATPVPTLA